MSDLINLNSLFGDILPPSAADLREQGMQEAKAAQLPGGMAALLAPQRFNNIRQAAGGLFGVDTSTSKERLQQALTQIDMSSPQGQKKAVELIRAVSPKDALQLQNVFDSQAQASADSAARTSTAATGRGNMNLRERELNATAASTDRDIAQMVDSQGELTTIMEDGQGNFFDLDNNPIRIPQDFKVLESATLSGAREDLGLGASARESLEGSEIAVRQFLATGEDALKMLKDSPDVNTFVAKAAGIAIGLEQEAKALGRSLGLESEKVTELTSSDEYDATFRELGINENRTKGLITSLAFQAAAASGQTGRDISNRDIERFIVEIGGNASNPEAFRASLVDVMERSVRNFKTKYSVLTREEYVGTLEFNAPVINDDGSSGSARVTLPPSSGAPDTTDLSDMTTAELLESLR
jgi:hypothetical protein